MWRNPSTNQSAIQSQRAGVLDRRHPQRGRTTHARTSRDMVMTALLWIAAIAMVAVANFLLIRFFMVIERKNGADW